MLMTCRHPARPRELLAVRLYEQLYRSRLRRVLICCSLVNVLGSNQWSEDVVPTVAFNLRQVRKGNVTMKVWDVAVSLPSPSPRLNGTDENQGQPKFRSMWDRYCRGADAIV